MSLPRLLSEPGPLLVYLQHLHSLDARKAKDVIEAVRAVFNSPEGRILLELLEVSTISTPVKVLDDPRALAARNSQAFIAADLRRIMSDEYEKLAERKDHMERTHRPRAGRG